MFIRVLPEWLLLRGCSVRWRETDPAVEASGRASPSSPSPARCRPDSRSWSEIGCVSIILRLSFLCVELTENRLWNYLLAEFFPRLSINVGLHSLVTWMESNSRISISPFYHSTIVVMFSVFQVALGICFKIVFNYLFTEYF